MSFSASNPAQEHSTTQPPQSSKFLPQPYTPLSQSMNQQQISSLPQMPTSNLPPLNHAQHAHLMSNHLQIMQQNTLLQHQLAQQQVMMKQQQLEQAHQLKQHQISQSHSQKQKTIGPEPKRVQVKNACTNCQKACKKCDNARPCARCIKFGEGELCVDSVRKDRRKVLGVRRGPYKLPKKGSVAEANETRMYHIVDAKTGELIKKRLFIMDPQAKTEVSDQEDNNIERDDNANDNEEPNKGFKLNVLANLCSAVLDSNKDSNTNETENGQQIQKLESSHQYQYQNQQHQHQHQHQTLINQQQNANMPMFYPFAPNGYPSVYGFPYVMSSNQALPMTPPRSYTEGLSSRNSPKDSHLLVMSDMAYHFTQFPQAPFFAPTVEAIVDGQSMSNESVGGGVFDAEFAGQLLENPSAAVDVNMSMNVVEGVLLQEQE